MSFAAKAKNVGYAPTLIEKKSEKAKYTEVWKHPEYRGVAPGEDSVVLFRKVVAPKRGETVIDYGCGTGRGSQLLAMLCGLDVTMLDFAANCLDEETVELAKEFPARLRFVEQDLSKPIHERAEYGYCTDVMEHIPPEQVDTVLKNILSSSKRVFFQIATVPDVFGEKLLGEPLHLTVQPFAWWEEKFKDLGCAIRWSQDAGEYALFYVSKWITAADLVPLALVNTGQDVMRDNMVTNLLSGYEEVTPHETNDIEVILLAGGPSLNQFEDKIRELRESGMPLITVNGTYNWAIERGLKPSCQIVGDCREFNKKFLEPHVDTCRYLINAAASPVVVNAAPKDRTLLWVPGGAQYCMEALQEVTDKSGIRKDHFPAHGGSTVMLRALPLMRMLGYRKFHIFGWDSCVTPTEHHAYDQPENSEQGLIEITVGGRTFQCANWMAVQAAEFISIQQFIADEIEIEVYGDGLIAHIIKTASEE